MPRRSPTVDGADLAAQFARDPWPVVGFLTAEHTTLTSMRATTTAEAGARVTSFLGALSAALVALGFVFTASGGFGRSFAAFAAVALGVTAIVGVVTFLRCVQGSIEDLRLLGRIEQVRATYLELAPGLTAHLAPPAAGHADAVRQAHGMAAGAWAQLLLTMAGLVGLVTSTTVAGVAGFGARLVVDHTAVAWAVAVGTGVGALTLHIGYQMRTMRAALVPDPPGGPGHR